MLSNFFLISFLNSHFKKQIHFYYISLIPNFRPFHLPRNNPVWKMIFIRLSPSFMLSTLCHSHNGIFFFFPCYLVHDMSTFGFFFVDTNFFLALWRQWLWNTWYLYIFIPYINFFRGLFFTLSPIANKLSFVANLKLVTPSPFFERFWYF